ncbi:MAG: AAA family ATPase, partial [Erysipelothrix sp.]|nr:AAA family ATPase [Erysipelothrix sp.]
MEQSVKGVVEVTIYKNEQSGFGIYRIVLFNSNQKPLTIKGPLFDLEKDAPYEFFGSYKEDSRYGMQFDVTHYQRMLPQHKDFIVRFLSGPNFPGIGEKTASALVDKYGESLLEDIRNDESMVMELKGVSKDKMADVLRTIRTHDDLDNAVSFLLAHGLSNKQVIMVNKVFGERSIAVLRENPYRLVSEVDGIGFKTADKMASSLGFDFDHPYRIEAMVLDRYKNYVFSKGDSYILEQDFLDLFNQTGIDDAYQSLLSLGELVLDGERLYHKTQYVAETYIANTMLDFEYGGTDFEMDDLDRKINRVEDQLKIEFDDQQKEAIERFFLEDVMVLTGGPGTGKSTLLSGIVTLLQSHTPWLQIAMCAPTGRAAK